VKIKADAARSATNYIGMNVAPWGAYSGYNGISLADTFKVYTFLFNASTTDNAARIVFDLGNSTTDVAIAEVKLEEVTIQWPTSSNEIENLKTKVYPNPSSGKIFISNRDNFNRATVYNIAGKPVAEKQIEPMFNEIDVSGLEQGLYFVRLTGPAKSRVVKVLVVR
jgi:hypothetical protein